MVVMIAVLYVYSYVNITSCAYIHTHTYIHTYIPSLYLTVYSKKIWEASPPPRTLLYSMETWWIEEATASK